MMTAVATGGLRSSLALGAPVTVFNTKYATPVGLRNYDVSADGQKFLMLKQTADLGASATLVVVPRLVRGTERTLRRREVKSIHRDQERACTSAKRGIRPRPEVCRHASCLATRSLLISRDVFSESASRGIGMDNGAHRVLPCAPAGACLNALPTIDNPAQVSISRRVTATPSDRRRLPSRRSRRGSRHACRRWRCGGCGIPASTQARGG